MTNPDEIDVDSTDDDDEQPPATESNDEKDADSSGKSLAKAQPADEKKKLPVEKFPVSPRKLAEEQSVSEKEIMSSDLGSAAEKDALTAIAAVADSAKEGGGR